LPLEIFDIIQILRTGNILTTRSENVLYIIYNCDRCDRLADTLNIPVILLLCLAIFNIPTTSIDLTYAGKSIVLQQSSIHLDLF